jgi:cellulose 1,4-beta-cellobiosidase
MVHLTSLLLATAAVVGSVAAAPKPPVVEPNPWEGKDRHVVQSYGKKLDQTIAAFEAKGDKLNAARTRTVQQKISTFTWVTSRAHLSNITTTITEARQQKKKGKEMIVVLSCTTCPTVTARLASPQAS